MGINQILILNVSLDSGNKTFHHRSQRDKPLELYISSIPHVVWPGSANFLTAFRTVPEKRLTVLNHIVIWKALRSAQSTFPHNQYPPAPRQQAFYGSQVPFAVAVDLLPPEINPCGWPFEHRAVVLVPETSVCEDDTSMLGKHHIRFPRQILPVQPEAKSACMQAAPKNQFGLRIPAPDSTHVEPALLFRQDISHGRRHSVASVTIALSVDLNSSEVMPGRSVTAPKRK